MTEKFTREQRLRWGASLIAVSLFLVLGTLAWRTLAGESAVALSTAQVSQYRSNVTGSTTSSLLFPTQTDVEITYPAQMGVDETRRLTVAVERSIVVFDLDSRQQGTADDPLKKSLEPVKSLGVDVEVRLVSSGFEIRGFSKQKAGALFPLNFSWTISPKKEGVHELLVDLTEIVRDARTDSAVIGTTEVRAGGAQVELKDGGVLPLAIKVTGHFGIPAWVVSAAASVPGLVGFVLTYPLIVDWLKRRRDIKPNNRLQRPPPRAARRRR